MTKDRFDALLDDVERQFRRSSSQISVDTKAYANRRLAEITPRIERVQRENAYQDFLLDHIQAEAEKFQLYIEFRDSDIEDDSEFVAGRYYDELREHPVCLCDGKMAHHCPLKQQKLPWEVRNAEDIDDGIREFKANHPARPVVLLDAQREFSKLVAAAERDLRELMSVLTSDEIPSDGQAAASTPIEQPSD